MYIQYTNPAGYPPLEHSSRILADRNWEVLFLGAGALGSGELRFPPHPRIRVKQVRFVGSGWRQKLHYLMFAMWVFIWLARERPSWAYLSDPLTAPIGLLIQAFTRIRVLYHEHDGPAGGQKSLFMRGVLAARRRLARVADVVVVPNAARAALMQRDCGRGSEIIPVWNCPRRGEAAGRASVAAVEGLKLHYHGTLNPLLLPASILEAMARSPKAIELTVVGYETVGNRGFMERWLEAADRLRVRERIRYVGPLPRAPMMEHAMRADVGLCLMPANSEDPNLANMAGASNKVFDYMACGLALIVTDAPEWRNLCVSEGFGIACDPADPDSLASAFARLAANADERAEMGRRARRRIDERWNYETCFAPVLGLLEA